MEPKRISSISDTQRFIKELYPNSEKDFSYIFGYAARSLGYLGKSLNQKTNSSGDFIRSISWIIALANNIEIDLEKAIISRHPDICPYCVTKPCICLHTGKRPAQQMPAYKIPDELFWRAEQIQQQGAQTFDLHSKRLSQIYPGNLYVWSAIGSWQHTSKMQEELAEVHEASTRFLDGRKNLSAVSEEFADLFAWILSSWSISHPNRSIDDEFINFYLSGCPVCGQPENCKCEKYKDKKGNLVDKDKIEEIEKLFTSLAGEADIDTADVDEIRASLKKAAESQSEPIAREAIAQTRDKASEIEKMLERGAKNSKNVAAIVASLKGIFSGLSLLG